MTDQADLARGRTVVERWCILAEQRLDYLTELYESGRWRRFHTERDFLENVQEAKRAVTTWRGLLNAEAAANNRPISVAWIGSDAPLEPRRPALFADEPLPETPRTFELPLEESPPVAPVDSIVVQAAEASEPEAPCWEAIDLSLMQQRYPLLRPSF